MVPNESETSTCDAMAYKKRFPSSVVAAPASVKGLLQSKGLSIDTSVEDIFGSGTGKDYGISVIVPPMTKSQGSSFSWLLELFDAKRVNPPEVILDVPLEYGERALMFGGLISNLKIDTGLRGRLLLAAGMVSDGLQPQVPSTIRAWGFSSRQVMIDFFSQLSAKTKSNDVYRVITMQHGAPVYFNVPRKLKKIADGYGSRPQQAAASGTPK